jgi:DNA invertase Pin-like site-specific DNA recombinase
MAITDRAVRRQHWIFREVVISILATNAWQERIRLSERTRAGLEQAGRKGKILERPRANVSGDATRKLRSEGSSCSAIADRLGVARSTAQLYANVGMTLGDSCIP